MKYTPLGTPLYSFTLAVWQEYFGKKTMGYFEVLLEDAMAEKWSHSLRIGQKLSVSGSLWSRAFKDKFGKPLSEMKVVAKEISQ